MPEKIPSLLNKPIGTGNEKRVFQHPNNSEKVIGQYRDELTNEEIKSVYYFGKLVQLLFPESYTAPTQVGNDGLSDKSMFIAPRVSLDPTAEKLANYSVEDEEYLMGEESSVFSSSERNAIDSFADKAILNPQFRELSTAMRYAGLPIDSENPGNFTINKNGTAVYLDVMQPFVVNDGGVILRFNKNNLIQALTEIEDEATRNQANFYLSRTLELYEEAKSNWQERSNETTSKSQR